MSYHQRVTSLAEIVVPQYLVLRTVPVLVPSSAGPLIILPAVLVHTYPLNVLLTKWYLLPSKKKKIFMFRVDSNKLLELTYMYQ